MSNRSERKQKVKNDRLERDMQRRQESFDNKSRRLTQKYTFKSVIDKLRFETYTKRLVAIIIGIGLIDMQLSYVLAFMGCGEIAETLSVQVCTTILGTAMVYMIRAYFDTKAEKSDQRNTINSDAERDILNKVEEVFANAGMDVPSDFEDFNTFRNRDDDDDDVYASHYWEDDDEYDDQFDEYDYDENEDF